MIRTAAAVLTATVLLLTAALVFVVREQRQQAPELRRLTQCVSILERTQGKSPGEPIKACPLYN